MGTYKQGILGGFSGKVGTVIGSFWKGKNVMRGLPRTYNDAKSEAQLTQRMRMSLANDFLTPISSVVTLGYQQWRKTIGERNAAISQIMKEATVGTYPSVTLDYNEILLGKGSLSAGLTVVFSQNSGKAMISWDPEDIEGYAEPDDRAVVVLYNITTKDALISLQGTLRSTGADEYNLPLAWSGQTVECYFGFASADAKRVSNISSLGSIIVA